MAKLRSWQKHPAPQQSQGQRSGEQEWQKRGMTKHSAFSVGATQIAAYFLLLFAVFSLGGISTPSIIGLGFLLLSGMMVTLVGWPFGGEPKESVFGRVLASLTMLAAIGFMFSGDFYSDSTFSRWAYFMVGVFLVLVFASFLRQMLRENRKHMIASLSRGLFVSVVALGAASWMFLPSLMMDLAHGVGPSWLPGTLLGVLVVAAVALLIASIFWWNGMHTKLPFSWMGTGMVPVLMMGFLVYVAAFFLHIAA